MRASLTRREACDLALTLAALVAVAAGPWAQANPQGLTLGSGTASVSVNGPRLTIGVSHNAYLNWSSFNIAPGETTTFVQPSAAAVVWNRVNDANPSQIFGNLNANGVVVLMNPSGFYFGQGAVVNAAGLVVSTALASPVEPSGGMFWQFNGAPPLASIINYGQINIGQGGSAFLIANRVENHGSISAPGGNIGLAAGGEVLISERPDGRGLSAKVQLPSGSVDNTGRLIADGGTIALQAQVVNQNGLAQANSVREQNGVIELFASESVNLGAGSVTAANGDGGVSSGGRVEIKSGGSYADADTSRISVAGGGQGGNGGQVEISAPVLPAVQAAIDGRANAGGTGGRLVIDPTDIVIGNTGTGSAGTGTVNAGSPPGTLNLNVNSAFTGFSQIDLQATRNITLASGTAWDLTASTGVSAPGCLLKLEAGNSISVLNGASISGGPGWSVVMQAGRNFTLADTVTAGVGNILFSGTGSLQTQDGNINLLAGNNVTVGGGFVRTMAGGNIAAQAVAGSINTGTKANGFLFRPTGYLVDPDLGGISTADGGNVSLSAGLDIISYLPGAGPVQTDAGSGAFGAAPGNVTMTAGRDVLGHFVAANGTGTVAAGWNAGNSATQLALSLVSGGWNVTAANDIVLQEIRNPNGVFNNLGFGSSATKHLFDYSADAYANLTAGNSVQLLGGALPRYSDTFEQSIHGIYPGTLNISAGAGEVVLGNDVTLFPSPNGNLTINTTGGGSLTGTRPGDLTQLIVSDSGKTQYRKSGDFGLHDHAAVPVHLADLTAVTLNIAGDMSGILLGTPKRAEITVGGNMVNSRFEGQNLHAGEVTKITVAGDILNRNEFTSVPLATAPDFSVFALVYPPLPALLQNLPDLFHYDAGNGTLTLQGRMTGDQLQALLSLQVQTFDAFGQPVLDAAGVPVTQPAQFTSAAVLQQLFTASQDIPVNPNTGYRLGGGGTFNITARNLDLGATAGIVSQGPRANPALANYFTRGADINVNLTGNLDTFSTTISSLNGGNVAVTAGGTVNVGSGLFAGNDTAARGIFTVDPSDLTVIAGGDINVQGSRIAAYDGGNVTVRSLTGSVVVGAGGMGSVTVEKIYVDPVTRAVRSYAPTIPGSGILATTFPASPDAAFPASTHTVGNILVETPRGDIHTGAGGIVQVPLNGTSGSGSVTLSAGSKDAAGDVTHLGNIDASGGGVIGSTVKAEATGNVTGVFFAQRKLDIQAVQNVNVVALAQGNVTVDAGGTVSGTLAGEGINASGGTIDATLLSQNVTTSGTVSSSQVGFTPGTAANATAQSLTTEQGEPGGGTPRQAEARKDEPEENTDETKPRLARAVNRVTLVLPK